MSTSSPYQVFLVDDHPVVRQGLRHLFEQIDLLSVVGEAATSQEALAEISRVAPDLALIDISLNGTDGIELTRRLAEESEEVHVLVISMHEDPYYVKKALDAGADGYVLKDKVNEVLLEAAETILKGEQYLCPDAQKSIS